MPIPIYAIAALVATLTTSSTALADASTQGCQSSGDNAAGCLGAVFAAPAPLAEGGLLLAAVGAVIVAAKRRGRRRK